MSLDNKKLEDALRDSFIKIKNLRDEVKDFKNIKSEPIAIIGMGCRYPGGANNPEAFWNLLENGIDGISEVPKDRFDIDQYYDPDYDVRGKMYTRSGGFLNVRVDLFDADFFGISPKEAEELDPQQRLLLEVTWEALENACIPPASLEGSRTGLYAGMMYNDYLELIADSTGVKGMGAHFGSGNAFSAAVGRVSYFLGLQGPCMAIDTACSSSLVAINSACESLRLGQCDLALAGGVSLMLAPAFFISACQSHMLSPDGHCKTFDKSADGYARAEGCGMIVLKRLSDAERDGDSIYALIRSSGVNHGGATSGLTVPNGKAQEYLIRQVLREATLKPEDIDYVEAHGTGTALGDPIEVRALSMTYGQRDSNKPLLLGSAKSNIGHSESAAGVAGVIKIILSLNHEMLPPNLNFKTLNPNIDLNFPVKILTEKTPWSKGNYPRRAGVSSFGFSGINAHIIIEEAPMVKEKVLENKERSLHILTLSAKSEAALEELILRYRDFLNTTDHSLADICYSANTGRNHDYYRMAVVAKDLEELKTKIDQKHFIKGSGRENKVVHDFDQDVEALALLYTQGARVDWRRWDAAYPRKKVALPTYPFQRQRYWSKAAVPTIGKRIESVHPLLGEKISTPLGEIIYRAELNPSTLSYLNDHRVYGEIIYPAAAYLEMMLAAGLRGLGDGEVHLKDVSFEAVLSFVSGKSLETEVLLNSREADYEVSVYSHAQDQSGENVIWHSHARGSLEISEFSPIENTANIEEIKSRCEITRNRSDFYQEINSTGIHYGEQFQGLQSIFIGKQEALGDIRISNSTQAYFAHPALLDAAFQLLGVSILNEGLKSLFLPVGCDSLVLYASLGDQVFAHWQETAKSEMGRSGDLTFYAASGKILAKISGIHYRKTTEAALKHMLTHESVIDEWLYEWTLKEKSLAPIDISEPLGLWLLLEDERTSDTVGQLFEQKGASIHRVSSQNHPKTKEAFIELLNSKNFSGILHVSSSVSLPLNTENIRQAQVLGTESLLHLTQALVQSELRIPLLLITHNVTSGNISQSPLYGFYKTLLLEHPELELRLVDVDNEIDFSLLIPALFSNPPEPIIVLKKQQPFVPRFTKIKNYENEFSLENKIRQDATYLITGGLGGLGLSLLSFLMQKGAKHFLLTGRRELDLENKQILKTLESEGLEIIYESMDIGDEKSVANLINRLEQSQNPLKGIFHLAGVLEDATLMDQDWTHFEHVFRPKVYGSFYLHQYSKNLDLFVMFSSMASSLGSPGQSNYSAANAFMDALCEYRKEQGLPANSISWGPWAEVGMAKNLVSRHAKSGAIAIKPKDGMRALELALGLDRSHITIVNIHWKNYLKLMIESPAWLEDFLSEKTSQDNLITQLEKVALSDRFDLVKTYVTEVLKSVLGLSSTQTLDEGKSFFDMGLDSLMAIELKNRLQMGVGKSAILSPTVIFDHENIQKMAEYLLQVLTVEKDKHPVKLKTEKTSSSSSNWIIREKTLAKPNLRVFCFHHAGGSARSFKAWQNEMPEGVELNLIQLPGREERFNEPMPTELKFLVVSIVQAMLNFLDRPYIIFAHSFGAMVASEVVRALRALNLPLPRHLIMSGFTPLYFNPGKFSNIDLSNMSDEEFLEFEMKHFEGLPEAILNDPEALKLTLSLLRKDMGLLLRSFILQEPFNIPITSIHAKEDRGVSEEDVKLWSKATIETCQHFTVPGKHLSILEDPKPYIDIIKKVITQGSAGQLNVSEDM